MIHNTTGTFYKENIRSRAKFCWLGNASGRGRVLLTLQSDAGAVHNGAAVLFTVSLRHVNSVIYFQMLERHPDLVCCVDLCRVVGLKCSVQSLIPSPHG